MNLFVLVRILFQYLEKVDPSLLLLAKEVSFMFKLTATTSTFADITLKKYAHVYLRTHDWMTGVKILAGSVTVTPYSSERCFSEHHHAVPTPNVQLSLPYLFR
jgi:hypothetical protein